MLKIGLMGYAISDGKIASVANNITGNSEIVVDAISTDLHTGSIQFDLHEVNL